jgi:hypothetical protein
MSWKMLPEAGGERGRGRGGRGEYTPFALTPRKSLKTDFTGHYFQQHTRQQRNVASVNVSTGVNAVSTGLPLPRMFLIILYLYIKRTQCQHESRVSPYYGFRR